MSGGHTPHVQDSEPILMCSYYLGTCFEDSSFSLDKTWKWTVPLPRCVLEATGRMAISAGNVVEGPLIRRKVRRVYNGHHE